MIRESPPWDIRTERLKVDAARTVVDFLVRGLAVKDEIGLACPYCFEDTPHSASSHSYIADRLEEYLNYHCDSTDSGVILRGLLKRLREHSDAPLAVMKEDGDE